MGTGDAVVLPPESRRVDHEAELGIVMGRRCRRLARGEALGAVRGYTCVNDVTARDIQRSDVQYTRGKGFDTFCPLGPWVETDLDPHAVVVRARVNGQVRQEGNSSDLIHGVEDLLVFISGVMTLLPGDVIATGTPPGVGPLAPGDVVEVEVGGVGVLRNAVT
jgi:2-keto-4-pentenoate hydratase/2-oxohepta-3-ene-1,7-dioic acid hydratase in catechol pathway